ncbi:MAG: GlsB/YeaQ/YmgE family stress response membrane protein [Cytophagales bacterium]
MVKPLFIHTFASETNFVGVIDLFISIITGGISGWLAGQIVKGKGFGSIYNIIIGILGGFLAGFLGIHGSHWIGQIIASTIGAIAMFYLIGFVSKKIND